MTLTEMIEIVIMSMSAGMILKLTIDLIFYVINSLWGLLKNTK